MNPRRFILALIVLAYLALGTIYSVTTPLFEVSDELWHYPMVKYIADNGDLPVQDPANPGPWRQEGSQPPLYYMMGAALTFWVDTSDLNEVRRVNPHANIGEIHPDGNANMMVHRPELEAFPWQGTALAVHLVRLLSVALGAGTVVITYLLGRQLFPEWDAVALTAAALVAFLPMFVYIHGSVNNDALSNLLGNLLTLLLVWLLLRESAPQMRDYVFIGLAMGAGLLSKGNLAFLIPVVAGVLLILSVRYRDWKPFVIGGLVSGGLTNLIAGWWYVRNWHLYGDPTGLNVFLDTVGRRAVPGNAAQLWAERNSFLQAYWGFFGGVNVPLADWAYVVFNLIGGLSLLIGLVYLVVTGVRRTKPARWWWSVAVTLVWMVLTSIAYLRWTAITPASQGRLVFGALSSISVWMAVGLCWPLRRWGRPYLAGGAVGYFAAVSLLTPFVLLNPIYSPLPSPEQTVETDVIFRPVDGDGAVMLTGAAVQSEAVQPDEYVFADMNWQLETELDRDWSLFVHLETPEGVIIAQRDMYPGRGLLATSDMTAGRAWQNPVAVDVPRGAYASGELNVMVGWYHLPTGERMQLPDGGERVHIGTVTVEPRESELDVPNPLSVSFDDRIEMVGYEYSTLTPAAGEDMQVTLYWRALEPMETDYVVFVHVIDPVTWSIVGTSDAQPANWTRPTTTWEVGEIIEDTHTFTINDDAPAMPYEVEVGIYSQQPDGTLQRLRVFAENGGMPNDYIYLSRVRVMPEDDNGGGSQ